MRLLRIRLSGPLPCARADSECLYSPRVRPLRFPFLLAVFGGLMLACSPTLNWREVRPDGVSSMTLLLPCKPDRASKTVPLGGRPTRLSMTGCEAGGAVFALAVAELADPDQTAQLLAQWQSLTLAHMRAAQSRSEPVQVSGADARVPALHVWARGTHPDGQAIEGQARYFARGSQMFQAVIYAPRIAPEAAETFFSSFKLP